MRNLSNNDARNLPQNINQNVILNNEQQNIRSLNAENNENNENNLSGIRNLNYNFAPEMYYLEDNKPLF